MTIASLDDYIAATKQRLPIIKLTSFTTVGNGWYSLFDVGGMPGAGTLAGTSTAAGVVPVAGNAGYPAIAAFDAGAKGYLSRVEFGNTVPGRLILYDRLFVAGAYNFNANTTLSAQPSYSGRLPGTDYKGIEIWVEQVTAATGNQAVSVGYTKEDGTTGRSTGAVGIAAAPGVRRCWQLPLQSGDLGVQKIESVVGSVASAGTFNVMALRRLWSGRVVQINMGDVHDLLRTGLTELYATSALYMLFSPDSTASGVPDLVAQVASK